MHMASMNLGKISKTTTLLKLVSSDLVLSILVKEIRKVVKKMVRKVVRMVVVVGAPLLMVIPPSLVVTGVPVEILTNFDDDG